MEDLIIQGEKGVFFIPDVNFSAKTGKLSISGASYLEDTSKFYAPVLEWLNNFYNSSSLPVQLDLNLNYYNTSSSRSILDILLATKEYEKKGRQVVVNWHHKGDDPEVYDEVQDYRIDTGLDIKLVLDNKPEE